jgi:hypothetical protein
MRCQRCDQRDRRPVRRAKLAERDAHRRGAPDSFDRSRQGRWLDLRSLDRHHVTARLRTLALHESCHLRP